LISVLVVALVASGAAAEVLWELVSPNECANGYFGNSVSNLGDVDDDGYDDIVVGAFYENGTSAWNAGRAYVFSGATGDTLYSLVSPNEEFEGGFGRRAANVGDMNGDSFDDVAVGAPYEGPSGIPNAGRAYVFSGQTGDELFAFVSPNAEAEGRFAGSISGAGDVNNDGYPDLIVGASQESNHAGKAYVFSGATGDSLYELVSPNPETGSVLGGYFGFAVSAAGDVNVDGYDDVLVGAYREDPGSSPTNSGRAYVFSGATGDTLYSLISPGEDYHAWFGYSVSAIADLDDDGYADLVVGAPEEGELDGAGQAYVFSGATGDVLYTLASPNEEPNGYFGYSVSAAGDIDGDGYVDVIVGAVSEDPGSSPIDAGMAYVFSGAEGILLYELVSQNEEESGQFAYSVSSGGDVNGDGYDDIVVGANQEDPGSSPYAAGRAYVFSWMHLSSSLSGNALELQWSTWSPATEYWIYGADNLPYFEPGFAPGYEYKLDEVVPPNTTWSSSAGVGDPDHNWTYLVIAVDRSENELARSNSAGEYDFQMDIP
jgi:hypothetical protein